jgi:hypothetical protein
MASLQSCQAREKTATGRRPLPAARGSTRKAIRYYSALMPMARMTSPSWACSVRTKAAKASGGSTPGSMPKAEWIARQITESLAMGWCAQPSHMRPRRFLRPCRNQASGGEGIRDHPIAPRSHWQNGHAERLIGSIRRECLDHIVIFGEVQLYQVLKTYAAYYNRFRTHL